MLASKLSQPRRHSQISPVFNGKPTNSASLHSRDNPAVAVSGGSCGHVLLDVSHGVNSARPRQPVYGPLCNSGFSRGNNVSAMIAEPLAVGCIPSSCIVPCTLTRFL